MLTPSRSTCSRPQALRSPNSPSSGSVSLGVGPGQKSEAWPASGKCTSLHAGCQERLRATQGEWPGETSLSLAPPDPQLTLTQVAKAPPAVCRHWAPASVSVKLLPLQCSGLSQGERSSWEAAVSPQECTCSGSKAQSCPRGRDVHVCEAKEGHVLGH